MPIGVEKVHIAWLTLYGDPGVEGPNLEVFDNFLVGDIGKALIACK